MTDDQRDDLLIRIDKRLEVSVQKYDDHVQDKNVHVTPLYKTFVGALSATMVLMCAYVADVFRGK